MKIKNFIAFYSIISLCGTSIFTHGEENSNPKMKFFNKNSQSCEKNKNNFKEKLESKIATIINGKTNHPKIIKRLVAAHQEDIKEVLLWIDNEYNSMSSCEEKDEHEALKELREDIQRIGKESELSLPWYFSETIQRCQEGWGYSNSSTCKNLAYAYDSFRLHSQGVPETRKIKSLDHQIKTHYDDKYTVAFLEKAKKRLQDDLKKIDAPLFNSLQKSGTDCSRGNNLSYFESLSEEDQKALTNVIEDVVCEKVTNFDRLAEEFQKIFYVFHEKGCTQTFK